MPVVLGLDDDAQYRNLMELHVSVVEALKGKPVPPDARWLADMQPLAGKLFCHVGTAYYLKNGTSLPDLCGLKIGYVDFPSIAAVTRAAIESYLAFHYIFVEPATANEKEFRHKLWTLGGLLSRQGFPAELESSKLKLKAEADQIEGLREEIRGNSIFVTLRSSRQKEALKGEWRLGRGWESLATSAGFGGFSFLYRHLCGHAHSGYLSVLQFSQAGREERAALVKPYLDVGLRLMALFVRNYSGLSAEAAAVLAKDRTSALLVEIWCEVSEGMSRTHIACSA